MSLCSSAAASAAALLFPNSEKTLSTHVIGGGEQPLFCVCTTGGRALMWDMRSIGNCFNNEMYCYKSNFFFYFFSPFFCFCFFFFFFTKILLH